MRRIWCVFTLFLLPALALAQQAQQANQCVIVVSVTWPDHDLSRAQVRVFKDAARQDLVAAFPAAGPEGKVIIDLEPGTYYATVVVDVDGDGRLSTGDGLGFYGVSDPTTDRPQPLEVKDRLMAVSIAIVFAIGPEGKLVATGVTPAAAPQPAKPVTLSGTLTGAIANHRTLVYLVPKSGQGSCGVTRPDAAGNFSLPATAGEYYLFAAQDMDDNEAITVGDTLAVYGYEPPQGKTFPATTFEADATGLALALTWTIGAEGLLKDTQTGADGPQVALQTLPAVLLGHLTGLPDDKVQASVRVCANARFDEVVATAQATGARFLVAVPAGMYYLNAVADVDGNGGASATDRIGFYGVTTLRKAHGPQPLALAPGELRPLEIVLSASLGPDLRPVPLDGP